jgi:hypothetical protein
LLSSSTKPPYRFLALPAPDLQRQPRDELGSVVFKIMIECNPFIPWGVAQERLAEVTSLSTNYIGEMERGLKAWE